MRPSRRRRPGFRLVDLLAALFLVAVLIGLLLPALPRAHVYRGRTECTNNLKRLGLAVHNYAGTYRNALPALSSDAARPKYGPYSGNIFVTLLPFVEWQALQQNALAMAPQA